MVLTPDVGDQLGVALARATNMARVSAAFAMECRARAR
jgi:hypothetical protein